MPGCVKIPTLAVTAEQTLRRALSVRAGDYAVQRMLATTLLSQHRFREAIAAARVARDARPNDAWNDGVIGDAHLELGEYDEAFDAFDRMLQMRPSAAAYAAAQPAAATAPSPGIRRARGGRGA